MTILKATLCVRIFHFGAKAGETRLIFWTKFHDRMLY
jgi:hypothetical protein